MNIVAGSVANSKSFANLRTIAPVFAPEEQDVYSSRSSNFSSLR
jgi:hypothetical protein